MKAKQGIFTPWANVLCYNCHGNEFPNQTLTEEEMVAYAQPIALRTGNQFTTCDKCKSIIQLQDSVAVEHNMAIELEKMGYEVAFAQTGGMNSACEIYIDYEGELKDWEDPPMYFFTFNYDGDNKYWIGELHRGVNEYVEDTEYKTDTYEEMMEYIKTLTNIKKINK